MQCVGVCLTHGNVVGMVSGVGTERTRNGWTAVAVGTPMQPGAANRRALSATTRCFAITPWGFGLPAIRLAARDAPTQVAKPLTPEDRPDQIAMPLVPLKLSETGLKSSHDYEF